MNIDELMAEATAKPGERIDAKVGLRVFTAVFHMRKAAVYMDGKRVPVGVARQGLIAEERRTGTKAVLCTEPVIQSIDDIIHCARVGGRFEVIIGGATFAATCPEGKNVCLTFNKERMTKARIEPLFEVYMRIERASWL